MDNEKEFWCGEGERVRGMTVLDKTPGHIANERKTLTTPSAWLPVAMALGVVAWAYIIGGVV